MPHNSQTRSAGTNTTRQGMRHVSCQQQPLLQSSQTQTEELKEDETNQPEGNQHDSEEYHPSQASENSAQSDPQTDAVDLDEIVHERKYIVTRSKLLSLFATCRMCRAELTPIISKEKCGTYVTVTATCPEMECQHTVKWENQEKINNTPAINILLSAAILFVGLVPQKVTRLFECMGIVTNTANTFFRHQKDILSIALELYWSVQRGDLIKGIGSDGVTCLGDGRCDSPGHSAKYGTYTLMNAQDNKVIDVQVVQSNECDNSNCMELEGLERALSDLKKEGVNVEGLVTDRHTQIRATIRDHYPGIHHLFDTWHIVKGLMKKIRQLTRGKDFAAIIPWLQTIKAHLYWCVSSTPPENVELRVAKWMSLVNHILNKHEGHSPIYPKCEHDELTPRKYLKPGSKAAIKLEELVTKKSLIDDIRQLSAKHQTYRLESYHSVVNNFAPKSLAFSYQGMRNRTILAALHNNENCQKEQSKTKAGKPRYSARCRKANKGVPTAAPINTPSTYGYLDNMLKLTIQLVAAGLKEPVGTTPPPLASQYPINKEEAVEKAVTRYAKRKRTEELQ